jgi:hypothetical protein
MMHTTALELVSGMNRRKAYLNRSVIDWQHFHPRTRRGLVKITRERQRAAQEKAHARLRRT